MFKQEAHLSTSFDSWLSDVRLYISEKSPALLPTLEIYLGEARFGRQYIAGDMMQLASNATVLEVGAGSMLLSCQLVREGFKVTALEPIGDGFSHFERLRELVLEKAQALGCLPLIIEKPIENLSIVECFDYAFSINVMEHVHDVALSIDNVSNSLKPGAMYHFTCPNYLFPYEPHFNIPTLFSKSITEKLLRTIIYKNIGIEDPEGTWKSLNWINTIQVKRFVKVHSDLEVRFNRNFLVSAFERIATDKLFALRRSKRVTNLIIKLVNSRVHYLFGFLPAFLQPIIDCRITKVKKNG